MPEVGRQAGDAAVFSDSRRARERESEGEGKRISLAERTCQRFSANVYLPRTSTKNPAATRWTRGFFSPNLRSGVHTQPPPFLVRLARFIDRTRLEPRLRAGRGVKHWVRGRVEGQPRDTRMTTTTQWRKTVRKLCVRPASPKYLGRPAAYLASRYSRAVRN